MNQHMPDPIGRTTRVILIIVILPPLLLTGLWIYSAVQFSSLYTVVEGTPSIEEMEACLEAAELTLPEDAMPRYWYFSSGLDAQFELKFETNPESAAALLEQASQLAVTQPDVSSLMHGSALHIKKAEEDRSITYELSDGTVVRIAMSKPNHGRTNVYIWYWEF